MPIYDIISHLAYVTDAQDVISVIVDGKVLMREQEVLTIDKNRVRKQARAIAAKIQEYLRKKGDRKKRDIVLFCIRSRFHIRDLKT